jgi:hypothetical protein
MLLNPIAAEVVLRAYAINSRPTKTVGQIRFT